ncbi:hypothetical protein Micbo1qcDRAFT_169300 [Microdochium bolleyi]|uniref:Acyl-coenzyme A thioesterase THEM4 n=1 Tax=Microdochium bolleyi TaxID=196109 RepID=A0A136IL88_9PEZI|nr:hypothetical protein Micbo1qcDRAFT_169300 [Microdochium bolleyi]
MPSFSRRHTPTAAEAAFLAANPWVSERFPDAAAVPFTPGHGLAAPVPPATQLHDRLFSRTLRTTSTTEPAVPVCLAYHDPVDIQRVADASVENPDGPPDMYLVPSATMVFQLGPGVNGFQGVTHGGMFAVLVDECVGNYLALNKAVAEVVLSSSGPRKKGEKSQLSRLAGLGDVTAFTVGMNVKFKKPIPTPAVVLVRSWLSRIEGRKIVIGSVIENRYGAEHGSCESIWYTMPLKKENGPSKL